MSSADKLKGFELRRVRKLVSVDPEVMGGEPVFRGTRVPVHLIAALLDKGAAPADLLEAYPRVTADMLSLTPLYAAAYPLRGRPRVQPWHGRKPVKAIRRKLATIDAATTLPRTARDYSP